MILLLAAIYVYQMDVKFCTGWVITTHPSQNGMISLLCCPMGSVSISLGQYSIPKAIVGQ